MMQNTPVRRRQLAFVALLSGSTIGSVAGLLIPSWSVSYPNEAFVLAIVVALLGVALLATLGAGVLLRDVRIAAALVVGDVVVATAIFMLSWFMFGPSAAVGLWLMFAGAGLWRHDPAKRRVTILAGATTLLVSTFVSLEVLNNFVDWPPRVWGTSMNALVTGLLLVVSLVASATARRSD